MTEQKYLEMPWSVEETVENLKEVKEIMIAKVRAVNLDGRGEDGVKEVEFDFDRAISALEEIQQYRALGTVEEFQEAMEKQRAKKPDLEGDGYYNGEIVLDTWICPNCGKRYEVDYDDYDYCPNCGQHLDWSEEE